MTPCVSMPMAWLYRKRDTNPTRSGRWKGLCRPGGATLLPVEALLRLVATGGFLTLRPFFCLPFLRFTGASEADVALASVEALAGREGGWVEGGGASKGPAPWWSCPWDTATCDCTTHQTDT